MTETAEAGADFAVLVERHRAELHAHCYRMLGSVHDADDALQETLIRAWRGAAGLRADRSARSWLYAIATNVCLTELTRRSKLMLPHDFSPAAETGTPPGAPIAESTWLDPYPSGAIAASAGSPEARYEQLESVELAFVAALQHLAANQRAVLLLREVLGFSAQQTAELLSTSVASVNSALQRARVAIGERVPERSQQETLRELGDDGLRELVGRYVDAWERCDVDAFAALLVADATFAMPPLATWYGPREAVVDWARATALNGAWRWRVVSTQANGQPALGFYAWDEPAGRYLPFALNVLTLRGALIRDVTAFIVRSPAERDDHSNYPTQPVDERRFDNVFARFGLPDRLA
jgi:RNA polymerase sigma-70 factor (ECF subfamily)